MTRLMKPITRKAIAFMPNRAFSFLISSSADASVDKRVVNEATPSDSSGVNSLQSKCQALTPNHRE